MSTRQRKFIEQAAKDRGLSWVDVESICFRAFGCMTEDISFSEARRLCQIVVHYPGTVQA